MTPAKALLMLRKRMEIWEMAELPFARILCAFLNSKRDPGDETKGRAPAPPIPLDDCRSFKTAKSSLVTKGTPQPGGPHNYRGARADAAAIKAWAIGKTKKKG